MEGRMDNTGVQAVFVAAGLSRLLKDIDLLSRASIRLQTNPVHEATLSTGASKLAGVPDLPPGVSWPERKGLPQSFIAQIHLSDVRPYDTHKLLPQDGMLWFFYDAQRQTFGADPTDLGGWRVIFMNDNLTGLQRHPAPAKLLASSQFRACSINFASEITLSQ